MKSDEETLSDLELELRGIDKYELKNLAIIKSFNQDIEEMPERKEEWFHLYQYFCDNVIIELYIEI